MTYRKVPAALMAGALVSCIGWTVAAAPGDTPATVGRIYVAHTPETDGCPALDWHIVVGGGNTLSGMVGANDMKTVFRVTGSYSGSTLRLDGTEVGGTRTAAVNGAVQSDGRLAMSIGGLPVGAACQGKTVYLMWMNPHNYYNVNENAGGGG